MAVGCVPSNLVWCTRGQRLDSGTDGGTARARIRAAGLLPPRIAIYTVSAQPYRRPQCPPAYEPRLIRFAYQAKSLPPSALPPVMAEQNLPSFT